MSKPLFLLAALGLAGCMRFEPVDGDEEEDHLTDDPALISGSVSDGAWRLNWRSFDEWDEGGCIELSLSNGAGDVSYWTAELDLNRPITDLNSYSEHMVVTDNAGGIDVTPWQDPSLDRGDTAVWFYCAEPLASVVGVQVSAFYEEGAGEEYQVYGGLLDDDGVIALTWEGWVEDEIACLDLEVVNLSNDVLTDWSIEAELDDDVIIFEADDLVVIPEDNDEDGEDELTMYPESGDDTLGAHGAEDAELCFTPYSPFEDIRAHYTVVETGTEDPPEEEEEPAEGELFGTLTSADGVMGLQWEQNGEANGGTCLDLTVLNLTDTQIDTWQLDLEFASAIDITSSTDVFVSGEGSTTLSLSATGGTGVITPYNSYIGQICIDPAEEPQALTATYTQGT